MEARFPIFEEPYDEKKKGGRDRRRAFKTCPGTGGRGDCVSLSFPGFHEACQAFWHPAKPKRPFVFSALR